MDITPEIPADRKYIDHYGDGGFRVGGERYEGSLIVAPEQVWPWAISDIAHLTAESVAAVLAADPPIELLLIGCGTRVDACRAMCARRSVPAQSSSTAWKPAPPAAPTMC